MKKSSLQMEFGFIPELLPEKYGPVRALRTNALNRRHMTASQSKRIRDIVQANAQSTLDALRIRGRKTAVAAVTQTKPTNGKQ